MCKTEGDCPMLKLRDWARFTLHGLWPNLKDGSWPEFCDKHRANHWTYDEDKVQDLLPEMRDVWPSLMADDKTSSNFWAHEWNKHSACALALLLTERTFFKQVLALNRRFSLRSALERAGIEPSASKTYRRQEVEAAIRDAYGANPQVHCTSDGQVTEVWMCLSLDLQPMDCHTSSSSSSSQSGGAPGLQANASCAHVSLPPIPGSRSSAGWGWRDGAELSDAARRSSHLDPAQPFAGNATGSATTGTVQATLGGTATAHGPDGAARPRRRRASLQPDALARALCIAAAAATLATLLLATAVSSWARRQALVGQEAGGSCGCLPLHRGGWCQDGSGTATGPVAALLHAEAEPCRWTVPSSGAAAQGLWQAARAWQEAPAPHEAALCQPLLHP